MAKKFRLGILGATVELQRSCGEALLDIAEVVAISGMASYETIEELDMMLLVMQPPFANAVRQFGRLRERHPEVKVLVLESGLRVNQAVEIVKFGAVDLLQLPDEGHSLARKVARGLIGTAQLTIDCPDLALLAEHLKPVRSVESSRSCFRTSVPQTMSASVVLQLRPGTVRLPLVDFSVATDGRPGGLGLRLEKDVVEKVASKPLPVAQWAKDKAEFVLVIEMSGQTVGALGSVARATLPPRNGLGTGLLGLTYVLSHQRDEGILQRLWVEAQRVTGRANDTKKR